MDVDHFYSLLLYYSCQGLSPKRVNDTYPGIASAPDAPKETMRYPDPKDLYPFHDLFTCSASLVGTEKKHLMACVEQRTCFLLNTIIWRKGVICQRHQYSHLTHSMDLFKIAFIKKHQAAAHHVTTANSARRLLHCPDIFLQIESYLPKRCLI